MATYPLSEAYLDGDVLSAADYNATNEGVNDLAFGQLNAKTASYTLALTDVAKVITMTVGSANNLTVPPNSSVAFPIGTQVLVYQGGAGLTTIVAGAGVTVRTQTGLKMGGQYAVAGLLKLATDEWVAFGNLTA